jgi:hypothetical protein
MYISTAFAISGRFMASIIFYFKIDTITYRYRLFRVLDDVKETVRVAAKKALTVLSNVTTRLCDPTHTSALQSSEILKITLQFLLQKGIVNEAAEVRAFSITQILKIGN